MKKIINYLAFLLSIGTITLSSCGGSSDKPITPPAPAESDLKYDENGNPIFKNVEIDFWSISIGSDGQIQQEIVNRFNEEFDGKIKVNRKQITHEQFSTNVVNTVISDPENAPDLIVGHGQRIDELQTQNIFLPLDGYLEKAKINFSKDHYYENIINDMYYKEKDGSYKLYGLPLDVHSNVLIARKDIIEENGLTVPTNYEEFINVNKTLAKKAKEGKYKYRQAKKFDKTMSWNTMNAGSKLYPLYMSIEAYDDEMTYAITGPVQNGTKIVNENGLPAWNTDSTVKYFENMRELMYPTDGSLPIIQKKLGYEFIDNFYKGNYVFCSTGPWNIAGYKQIINSNIGFGAGSFEDTMAIIPLSNIFAKTDNPEANKIVGTSHAFSLTKTVTSDTVGAACMVFADWMTKQYKDWLKGGHLPVLKSAMEDEEFINDEFYKAIGKYFGNQKNYTLGGKTPFYNEIFGIERNYGLVEVWHQTFNENSQNKTIKQIVDEQYTNTLSLINDLA